MHSPFVVCQIAPLSVFHIANITLKLLGLQMHVPDMAEQVPPPLELDVANKTLKFLIS